ncbi:MAG: hypothetical protein JKY32_15630 [Rhizobiales bacterium]|nr:hypothetical protein [Hyphomicrobiales bacterium]
MPSSRDSFWSFRIALTVLVTALVTVGIVFLTRFSLALWSNTLAKTPLPVVSDDPEIVSLGQQQFAIPGNILINATGDAIELAMIWPGLGGRTDQNTENFRNQDPAAPLLRLRLDRNQETINSEERFERIIMPAFSGEPLPAPDGLIARHFRPGTGFGPDVLYYAPLDTQSGDTTRYLTFCAEPFDQMPQSDTSFCQRVIQLTTDIRLEIRFYPNLLNEWKQIDTEVIDLVRTYLSGTQNTD